MLYPQIPRNVLDKIAGELKINLGFLNLTLKDNQGNEKTRYDKLQLISRYIEKQCNVGTVDSPKEYFKGVLPMRWGPYGDMMVNENEHLVYFVGMTNSETILGLGGSMHHIIGEERGESRPHSHSATFAIISKLSKELDIQVDDRTELKTMHFNDSELSLRAVMLATTQMDGPIQNFEFLAKKLLEGETENFNATGSYTKTYVVLGTPIYVAFAE